MKNKKSSIGKAVSTVEHTCHIDMGNEKIKN